MKCELCGNPKHYDSIPDSEVTLKLDANKEAEIQIVKLPWDICCSCFDELVEGLRRVFMGMNERGK